MKHESRQPSKAKRRAVRAAFDAEMLKDLCVRQDFSEYAERVDLPPRTSGWSSYGKGAFSNLSNLGTTSTHERFYYYKDNGSDILAIAHLDSVQDDGHCEVIETNAGLLAVSGTLDDRLGVYVILEMLPKLGITCDWLLTTDEEIAASTAEEFSSAKQYNWMFQFDRGGTDVVMYEYETHELCDLVEEAGGNVGQGTFSDICQLDHLKCAGMNWGVGYRDYHGPRAHAWLEDTFRQVARFQKFYEANYDLDLPHTPRWARSAAVAKDVGWDDWIEGDCGHDINVEDETSFIELDAWTIICVECVTTFDAKAFKQGA